MKVNASIGRTGPAHKNGGGLPRLRPLFGLVLAFTFPLQLAAAATTPTNYALAQNWVTLPNASQPVDVFFVYPTTYTATDTLGPTWSPAWNQSLAEAYNDRGIKFMVTSKASVFAKAGTNLYAPYFQQASGAAVLQALIYESEPANAQAAHDAMEVAYNDVANAFDYYLKYFNPSDSKGNRRPFILAGHSQGSDLLLMPLERRFADSALRKALVAAYVVGWSVTSDDMKDYPDSLALVGICGIPSSRQVGCIVTYNTQQDPGDWSLTSTSSGPVGVVRKNAYSVNPLSWVATDAGATGPLAAASDNLGAQFYQGQLPDSPPGTFTPDQDTGNLTFEINNYTGARSDRGALVIDPTVLPYPAQYFSLIPPYNSLPGWYHQYDYTFFYGNLQQNVMDRMNAYYELPEVTPGTD